MKARVYANDGFLSEKMELTKAVEYAMILSDRGNYNIRVVPAGYNKELEVG